MKVHKVASLIFLAKWFLLSVLLSSTIGSASAIFLIALDWVTQFREAHYNILFLLPIAGLCIGGLYHYWGKETAGGNNVLIDALHQPNPRIPFKMAPLVFISTLITHLFGGSAGREGTALQMAGSIASAIIKPFKMSVESHKITIIAAVAAGFGSVFGTPIAGALFSLEFFLMGKIRYNALFPAFAAAIFADWVTRQWPVNHTHYWVPTLPELGFASLLYSCLAGVVFGLCARCFSTSMHWTTDWVQKKIPNPFLRPFLGGILIILLILAVDTTRYIGLGIPTIQEAFIQTLSFKDFALKVVFTVLTLSVGFKGGEVTPLFFIGATLGSALSIWIPLPTALLTGMGFVAVFAGATNTPLACIVMAIELFGADCGVYVALACVTAYYCSGHTSIYRSQVIGEPKTNPFSSNAT